MADITAEMAAALARIDGAKTPKDNYKGEFFKPGKTRFAITEIECSSDAADGVKAKVYGEVVSSTNPEHKVGDIVVRIFKLERRPKFESQTSDADSFADLLRQATGKPVGTNVGDLSRAVLVHRRAEQLMRGYHLIADGKMNKKGDFVNVSWKPVEPAQTQEEIVRERARIDERIRRDLAAGGNSQPAQQHAAPAAAAFAAQYSSMQAPAPNPMQQQAQMQAVAPPPPPPPQPVWNGTQWVFPQPAPASPLLAQIPGYDRK